MFMMIKANVMMMVIVVVVMTVMKMKSQRSDVHRSDNNTYNNTDGKDKLQLPKHV